jgi:hypothetical protein
MVDEPETGRLEPYGKRLSSPGCYRARPTLSGTFVVGRIATDDERREQEFRELSSCLILAKQSGFACRNGAMG